MSSRVVPKGKVFKNFFNREILVGSTTAQGLGRNSRLSIPRILLKGKCVIRHLITTLMLIGIPLAAPAAVVDLEITGSWQASDYDVTSAGPDSPLGIPEENDDKVFGTSPSAGSTTFTLQVETSSVVHFATGEFGVTHDWFGYDLVSLPGGHSFGSATWDTADILTGLVGPNGSTAALWTDTDLTLADPTRLSFRMFGDWEGSNADLFIGSRTATTIGDQFLMWEYFGGEEIRSSSYSASVGAVPLPASSLLLLSGLFAVSRLRKRSL
ncbi:hypothetical protein PEL8287_01608 [Roseovarius litorisediminis]|uniref:Uncharacterized protein n=2 Tax=Roseovarius litorisediminis TaxID=1312363 RepID=A0A1Y5S5Q2_9RHOB|nr:hypothetical protein PEL8287_01608 [Roseovarius litorisediminis]